MKVSRSILKLLSYLLALIAALWTKAKEKEGQTKGIPLSAMEAQIASKLGIKEISKIRKVYMDEISHPLLDIFHWISKFSGAVAAKPAGLTLGYTILIQTNFKNDRNLLYHELVHVRQYEVYGGHFSFLAEYIYQCLYYGYERCPLELEAVRESYAYRNDIPSKNVIP